MKLKFDVRGMTCAACSARVEKVSKATPGVQNAEVNLLKGTMVLEADSDVCNGITKANAAAKNIETTTKKPLYITSIEFIYKIGNNEEKSIRSDDLTDQTLTKIK